MPAIRRSQEIERYLLDGERVVTAVHQHWAKIAEPVASGLVGGLVALWFDAQLPRSLGAVATIVWWLWFVVAGRTAYRLLQWRQDWFVATDKRLLLFFGVVTRKVSMMPLMKVTDMSYQRSIPGRLLGYGRFIMESAGQDQALRKVNWVPSPDANYRAICAEMFAMPTRGVPRMTDPWDELVTPAQATADWDDTGSPEPEAGADAASHAVSVYRSPDLRTRDRSADTGPIPIRPRRNRERGDQDDGA